MMEKDLYDMMRNLMRGAGVHLPPWAKLSSEERLGWTAITRRAADD